MVIIGVDPHKQTHTASAFGPGSHRVLATLQIDATLAGYRQLSRWAARFQVRRWAVENAHGLGRHLAQWLAARSERVDDVPCTATARVRELSRGGRRKNDVIDAAAAASVAALAGDVAAATAHPEHAPHAMYEIGVTLRDEDRLVEACDWYRRAIAAGVSPIQPYAAVNLGAVCSRLGDFTEAEAALQVAIDSDNREQADKAWINLGVLRKNAGDREGARNAWLKAVAGTPESRRQAMINLRVMRDELSGS